VLCLIASSTSSMSIFCPRRLQVAQRKTESAWKRIYWVHRATGIVGWVSLIERETADYLLSSQLFHVLCLYWTYHVWKNTCRTITMKNGQNYWFSGVCPSSGILSIRKHNVSETEFVSDHPWGEGGTYSVECLRKKKTNIHHLTLGKT
jgi:hypothetical protein